MTLQEAIQTGRAINRESVSTTEFYSFEDYQAEYGLETEDVLATDWIVEPVSTSRAFTKADLIAAWEAARVSSGLSSVKPANSSVLYRALESALFRG